MNLTGSLSVTGSGGTYSRIGTSAKAPGGTALQSLHIYGKLSAPGAHALCVARGNDDKSNNANGYLCLRDGGELVLNTTDPTVSMSGLMLARTSGSSEASYLNAAFVQEGGWAKIGRLMAGFETASRATVAVLGGVFELPFYTGTRFRIGHKGFGIFQQLGGTACVLTNCPTLGVTTAFRNDMFELGGGELTTSGAKGAAFYACGGRFQDGGDFYVQGNPSAKGTTSVPPAVATVDGDAVLDCYRLVIGANSTPGDAIVNVNGSARINTLLVTNAVTRAGKSELNGNGGTVAIKSGRSDVSHFVGLDAINVYAGGLTIDCGSAARIGTANVHVPLKTPGGYGVESIAYSGTQDYYYVPWIEISGGSGSNATAMALVDWSTHKITNIVVTCRGEGYKADDQLTVKFSKPSTAGLEPTVAGVLSIALTENRPGTLVKTGTERLVLYQQPEFDGTYEVREGLLLQSTSEVGSPKVSAVVLGGGATEAEFQSASGARPTESVTNLVNPRAVLTLKGNGRLSVPAGKPDAPNVQEFAELHVAGTGNKIGMITSDPYPLHPIEVRFGAFSFEPGSQVVLQTNANFRVYAPVAMAGQFLENVTFEGKIGKKVGYVAADGQIVPKSDKGLAIIIR